MTRSSSLSLLGAFSYYSGPKSLTASRDSSTGVYVRLLDTCLTRAVDIGVPGAALNQSLPDVAASPRRSNSLNVRCQMRAGW